MIRLASGRTISKQTLFLALNFGGWTLLTLVVAAWEAALWGLGPALLMDLIYGVAGILICFLLRAIYRSARGAEWSYLALGILAAILSALTSLLWWYADHWLDERIFRLLLGWLGPEKSFQRLLDMFVEQGYVVSPGGWLINTLSLLTWSMFYLGINAVLDLEMQRARAEEALKLADSARLRALQSQLKPHFLFNTLNGISTLIREGEGQAAGAMISTLSDFLRLTLDTKDSPEITVAQELMFIDQYLKIQRMRFGGRLHALVLADADTREARIPTLILQPLVENAVRHGILVRERGGDVEVRVRRAGDALQVSVEDDGDRPPPADLKFGVGLRNTEERLAALYGDLARLKIEASARGGYRVLLTLPYSVDPAHRPVPAMGSLVPTA